MTAEIINFRQARKRRAREAQAAEAAENRVRFGRTRNERERDEIGEARARLLHEAHLREPVPDTEAEDGSAGPAPKPPSPKLP